MSAFFSHAEFLRELGISRQTWYTYRHVGRLPPPERVGAHNLFTREYLRQCREILKAQNLPQPHRRAAGLKGGRKRKALPPSNPSRSGVRQPWEDQEEEDINGD